MYTNVDSPVDWTVKYTDCISTEGKTPAPR